MTFHSVGRSLASLSVCASLEGPGSRVRRGRNQLLVTFARKFLHKALSQFPALEILREPDPEMSTMGTVTRLTLCSLPVLFLLSSWSYPYPTVSEPVTPGPNLGPLLCCSWLLLGNLKKGHLRLRNLHEAASWTPSRLVSLCPALLIFLSLQSTLSLPPVTLSLWTLWLPTLLPLATRPCPLLVQFPICHLVWLSQPPL